MPKSKKNELAKKEEDELREIGVGGARKRKKMIRKRMRGQKYIYLMSNHMHPSSCSFWLLTLLLLGDFWFLLVLYSS